MSFNLDSADGLTVATDALRLAESHQSPLNAQTKRDYRVYRAILDKSYRDPNRANVIIPKIFSIVETKAPRDIKALFGVRPYFPMEARRKDWKPAADIFNEMLDYFTSSPQFFGRASLAGKIKTVFGTSFMESIPYYEPVQILTKKPVMSYSGDQIGMQDVPTTVYQLMFQYVTYAPWEIFFDPIASGLEGKHDCRFVVKYHLVSKRVVKAMAAGGAFPNLDTQQLDQKKGSGTSQHKGLEILRSIGLNVPSNDDDLAIMIRVETPDRYITTLNNEVTLRDIPNPYKHGKINLSRWLHRQDAHTQNQFMGIGEAKPNEILQSVLSDQWNAYLNSLGVTGQPVIVHDDRVDRKSIVWQLASRIAVPADNGGVGNKIQVLAGPPLPPDMSISIERAERYMDLTSSLFSPSRGEPSRDGNTLGEIAMTKQTGDEVQELTVKLGEQIFMADFGEKHMAHIAQFAMPDDKVRIVGQQKTALLMQLDLMHPGEMPGGYEFKFKGSTRVVELLVKQRNLKELLPIIESATNIPAVSILLDSFEFSEEEKNEILQWKQMMMMMQAQAQQEQLDIEREAKTGGKPGGKYKSNNAVQEAKSQGQESTRGTLS